jgi:serine/threonine protein kinase/response regulator of citrate/malate metabolism
MTHEPTAESGRQPQGPSQAQSPRAAQRQLRLDALQPGVTLQSYRVEGVLGQGGFGITYLARDLKLNTLVAIKEYLPLELVTRGKDSSVRLKSEQSRPRYEWGKSNFLHEARTLARFKHPNIVRVLTFFEERNTAYFVMEYERGESLRSVLKRRKTFEESEILSIALPLLDGLSVLHAAGFIHRDIKPDNIYIRRDGAPVLLDFGSVRRSQSPHGRSMTTLLTPGYAPHEQYHSDADAQGPWTDIYSLGGVLYQLVSGVKPTESTLRSSAAMSGKPDPLAPAVEAGKGRYPRAFLEAIDTALRMRESERPQCVADWKALLAPTASAATSRAAAFDLSAPSPSPDETSSPDNATRDTLESYLVESADLTPFPEPTDHNLLKAAFRRALTLSAIPGNAQCDARALNAFGPAEILSLDSGGEALGRLSVRRYDLVLCDAALTDMSGLEFVERLRASGVRPKPPVVCVAEEAHRHFVLDAILAGVSAYILRPYSQPLLEIVLANARRLELFNEVEEAMLKEAGALAEHGQFQEALDAYRELVLMEEEAKQYDEPGFREYNAQGLKELLQGRLPNAIIDFRKADKINEFALEAHNGAARAAAAIHDEPLRAEHAQRAADILTRIERMRSARKLFANMLKFEPQQLGPGKNPFATLGERLQKLEDYGSAAQAFQLAAELQPQDPHIYYRLAKSLAFEGATAQALEKAVLALRLKPDLREAALLYKKLRSGA